MWTLFQVKLAKYGYLFLLRIYVILTYIWYIISHHISVSFSILWLFYYFLFSILLHKQKSSLTIIYIRMTAHFWTWGYTTYLINVQLVYSVLFFTTIMFYTWDLFLHKLFVLWIDSFCFELRITHNIAIGKAYDMRKIRSF